MRTCDFLTLWKGFFNKEEEKPHCCFFMKSFDAPSQFNVVRMPMMEIGSLGLEKGAFSGNLTSFTILEMDIYASHHIKKNYWRRK